MRNVVSIYCDGGSRGNPGPAACAVVVIQKNIILYQEAKYLGKASNNFAEYQGVILGLEWVTSYGKKNQDSAFMFFLDSELITRQLNGFYKIKSENLKPLFLRVKKIQESLKGRIKFISVPRKNNKIADSLVNKELDKNLNRFTSA